MRASVLECAGRALCAATALWLRCHTPSTRSTNVLGQIQSGVALPESLPAALQNLADYRYPRHKVCALASWSAPAERFARRRRFGCGSHTPSHEIIQPLRSNPKRRGAPRVASRRTPKPGGLPPPPTQGMRASVLECAGRALCAATALWLRSHTPSHEINPTSRPNPKRRGAPRVASRRTPKPGGPAVRQGAMPRLAWRPASCLWSGQLAPMLVGLSRTHLCYAD